MGKCIIDQRKYQVVIYLFIYLIVCGLMSLRIKGVKIKRKLLGIRGFKNIYKYYVLLSNRKIGI